MSYVEVCKKLKLFLLSYFGNFTLCVVHLLRLRDVVGDMFLKFASTAPPVALSPQSKSASYLGKVSALPSPSPTSKMRRMVLKDPTKKGLSDYEKTLISHEQALKKGLHDLDKATNDFRESEEMKAAERKKMAEKLAQKKKRSEDMVANARRTGSMVLKTDLS